MKILVINGDCIQTNTSANLCHLAYLRGLVDAGHEVTLLSADGEGYKLDPAMVIPEQIKSYTYRGMSIYERLLNKEDNLALVGLGYVGMPIAACPFTKGFLSKRKKSLQF